MPEKDTLSNIVKGAYHKEDLVIEDIVLGLSIDTKSNAKYFAFDPNRPELVIEVKHFPGLNVYYNRMLMQHFQDKNIPVEVEGGSKDGVLYIKRASKRLDETEVVLVYSTEQGYLS